MLDLYCTLTSTFDCFHLKYCFFAFWLETLNQGKYLCAITFMCNCFADFPGWKLLIGNCNSKFRRQVRFTFMLEPILWFDFNTLQTRHRSWFNYRRADALWSMYISLGQYPFHTSIFKRFLQLSSNELRFDCHNRSSSGGWLLKICQKCKTSMSQATWPCLLQHGFANQLHHVKFQIFFQLNH